VVLAVAVACIHRGLWERTWTVAVADVEPIPVSPIAGGGGPAAVEGEVSVWATDSSSFSTKGTGGRKGNTRFCSRSEVVGVVAVLAVCSQRPHPCGWTQALVANVELIHISPLAEGAAAAAVAVVVVDDGKFSKLPASVKVVLLPACIPQRDG